MALLGAYAAYMAVAVGLLAVGVAIYLVATPHHEISLIRAGNAAAAWSLGGTVVGLALPLASVMTYSVSLLDMAMWGAVALATQLVAFLLVSLLMRDLRAGIEADRVGYGVLLGAVSVAFGVLNAGALSY